MKRIVAVSLLVVLVWAAGIAQAQTTLKLATIVGPDSAFSTSAVKFKELAESKSGGKLKIEVYPGGALAKNENVMLEGFQLGTIDLGAIVTSSIGGKWDPKFLAFDPPFLWKDREHIWRVVDGPLGKDMMKRLEPLGAHGFCYGGGYGFRNVLSTKRAIFVPDDLKGQTIRVPPIPTLTELFKSFGANPVPMAWGEVYLAVKQGTVDGLELPADVTTSDKFHEIIKYYSLTHHFYPPGIWMMAATKYNSLPPDLKKVIEEAMTATCAFHRQEEVKHEAASLALMKQKGVQVNEVKDMKLFQDRAVPVYKFLEGKVGKELMDRVFTEAKAQAR